MVDDAARNLRRERRRGRTGEAGSETSRRPDYRSLKNPFLPQPIFSADQVAAIHDTALRVLEQLGVKVLLPEARAILARAGALVDEDSQMVRIGRDIVAAALGSAPKSIRVHAGDRARDLTLELGSMTFLAGSGAPNVTDLEHGRRPGTLAAFEDLIRLVQHFDVLHMLGPCIEPQDIDNRFRHYAVNRAQLTMSDKLPFVFARGTPQVEDGFEMLRLARGLSEDEFRSGAHCYTVINTNSPRQLDVPMAQGIIDFAKAGQVLIITPFCLAGAMAPITVAGALTLQHAEALAGLTLAPDRAAGRAGRLWLLLLQCRHEVRGAGLRHAGARQGDARRRSACTLHRPSLAVRRRQCRQHFGRAGSPRNAVRAVGLGARRRDGLHSCRGLARRRVERLVREADHRHRGAADHRGTLRRDARRRGRDRLRGHR